MLLPSGPDTVRRSCRAGPGLSEPATTPVQKDSIEIRLSNKLFLIAILILFGTFVKSWQYSSARRCGMINVFAVGGITLLCL